MTSEGLGDTCAGKFPLVSMGGRAEMSSVRRRGAKFRDKIFKQQGYLAGEGSVKLFLDYNIICFGHIK